MKQAIRPGGPRITGKRLLVHIALALIVMAAAVLVRSASAAMEGLSEESRAAFTRDSGVPYLTDNDSYYHVRLVANYLDHGSLGDGFREDGEPWDEHSHAPEGRSAEYQPGIIWLTAGLQRLLGGNLDLLEYRLAAFVAALSALAAYLLGCRISGPFGGLGAGLLVACAPQYANRSCFGRFDTDMFVVVMELLLILTLTEALRAGARPRRWLLALGFALTTGVFAFCWSPRNSLLFAGLTLAGGFLFTLEPFFAPRGEKGRLRRFFTQPALWTLAAGGFLVLLVELLVAGPALFSVLTSALSYTSRSGTGQGVLPNLFVSISELTGVSFFPRSLTLLFTGYVPGEAPTAINGVGGLTVMVLCFLGLGWLLLGALDRRRGKSWALPKRESLLYGCVLGVWLAVCLYLVRSGNRFIEHLAIPVGLLAGGFLGWLLGRAAASLRADEPPEGGRGRVVSGKKKAAPARPGVERTLEAWLFPGALFLLAVVPAVTGAWRAVAAIRPSLSDASQLTMEYLQENTGEDAVLASWWDNGYFYESAADRACLWDGGSQGGQRAILVAKALVAEDLELSRRLLLMLATSGDAPAELLMKHTDAKTAYETLLEALPMEREAAVALLSRRCGLSDEEARAAEALLHPEKPRETYLVLSYSMTQQLGWYEYYANWEFTGRETLPAVTLYSYSPEGTPLFNTEEGQAYLSEVRGQETLWRLFFNAESTPCFTPVCESHDGLEHVRVWRVEP